MGIFTGGKSQAINSPRHLTLRHARRNAKPGERDDEPDLGPGEERLSSFWAPNLVAGPAYIITVEQTVKAPSSAAASDPLLLVSKQPFTVDAPQFTLPEDSVYSVYPPPGYPEENRMLPHIVLSDPHLPWERTPSAKAGVDPGDRNRVPWLVLLTFTQEELKLGEGSLTGLGEIKQTATLSVKMTVGGVRGVGNVASPLNNTQGKSKNDDKTGEFIFMKPDLFKSLFSTFDQDNKRVDNESPDVQQYQYLSHVRKINTTGMADVGIFSIVVGNRSGPLHNNTPATVAVHLLSIEGVGDMKFPNADKDYVSLCSLHSWNYTVMPPNMVNVYDTFVKLGRSLSVLRPPANLIDSLKRDKVPDRLAKRLQDGYSLARYRTVTGEPTMAFYRGPFTPTVVPWNTALDTCSNSGQDFQVLDQELGIMDVTYSSAWNIGRVLAAGDQSFTAALTRFRSAIHKYAMGKCKQEEIKSIGDAASFRTPEDVLCSLKSTVTKLNSIHQPHRGEGHGGGSGDESPRAGASPEGRWFRPLLGKKQYPTLGLDNPVVGDEYSRFAIEAAEMLSMSKDGTVYDETNSPVSTDWMVILAFVMDRMFMSGVPAHYLVGDPSHLTPESLRFFYIDPNWVDAMIDGALSLGNEKGTDVDRKAIKHAINKYIEHLPPGGKHRPQIPTYGFYLRSDLVTMFPDLKVDLKVGLKVDTVRSDQSPPDKAPLLRHEIVADGVMLGLFDRVPGSSELSALKFTQPPHQQRFAAADKLAADHLTVNMRKQYTISKEERRRYALEPHKPLEPPITNTVDTKDSLFLWNTVPKPSALAGPGTFGEADEAVGEPVVEDDLRMLRVPDFAKRQLGMLNERMGSYTDAQGRGHKFFEDDVPTSALFAMQLTDPIYCLEIDLRKAGTNAPVAALASLQEPPPAEVAAVAAYGQGDEVPPQLRLRTLHSTKHSVVPKLYPSTADAGAESEEAQPFASAASSGTGGEAGSGQSFQPAPLTYVPSDAPHVRPILRVEMPRPRPATRSQVTPHLKRSEGLSPDPNDPAGPPLFECAVYTPGEDAVVLDPDCLWQNLVFSVLVKKQTSNYMLKEFAILIPLGHIKYHNRNMLMETYDGAGATMLSNLRFNVLAQHTTLDDGSGLGCLMLRVVPRSSTSYISVKEVFEMGFLLNLVRLNEYGPVKPPKPPKPRAIELYTREYYKGNLEHNPIKKKFRVDLWDLSQVIESGQEGS